VVEASVGSQWQFRGFHLFLFLSGAAGTRSAGASSAAGRCRGTTGCRSGCGAALRAAGRR
jgi:hypothetical protein